MESLPELEISEEPVESSNVRLAFLQCELSAPRDR